MPCLTAPYDVKDNEKKSPAERTALSRTEERIVMKIIRKDELHVPLPDVDTYLARIGISERPAVNLENLDLLIRQQQYMVPFEDLDSFVRKQRVSIEIPALYEKIVTNRRGGYCFELNTLFAQLLEDLGFDVYMIFCRIVRGRTDIRPCLHCAMIVTLPDGAYFCDVGYGGPMPGGAVKVEDGFERTILGEHFGIAKDDEYWWTLWRTTSSGEAEDVLQFNLFPQTRSEFIPANAFCSGPEAIFTKMLMINRRTETGHVSITDKTFRIEDGDRVTDEIIEGEEQLAGILSKYFGL